MHQHQPTAHSSATIKVCLWMAIMLICRVPTRTPYEQSYYVFEAALLPLAIFLLAVAAWKALFHRAPVYPFSLIIASVFILPIMGIISSKTNFGQPHLLSLLCQRQIFGIFWVLTLFEGLNRKLFTGEEVHKRMIQVAWLTMAYWLYVHFFVDFELFKQLGGFIIHNEYRGTRLRVDMVISGYLIIYYTISVVQKPCLKNLSALYIGLYYLLVVSKTRQFGLAYAATALIIVLSKGLTSRKRLLKYVWIGLLSIPTMGIAALLFFPALIEYFSHLYGSAFKVVVFRESGGEHSANFRLGVYEKIIPYIKENYLCGTGKASHRWIVDKSSIGAGVHPTDVGILGFIYNYGLVGLGILLIPFTYAMRYLRYTAFNCAPTYILASKFYIIFYGILFVTGNAWAEWPAPIYLHLVLLAHHSRMLSLNSSTPPPTF